MSSADSGYKVRVGVVRREGMEGRVLGFREVRFSFLVFSFPCALVCCCFLCELCILFCLFACVVSCLGGV